MKSDRDLVGVPTIEFGDARRFETAAMSDGAVAQRADQLGSRKRCCEMAQGGFVAVIIVIVAEQNRVDDG